jgi:polysaccharide export outer membrane protein
MGTTRFPAVLLITGSLLMGDQHPPLQTQEDLSHYVLGPDDQIRIWALGIEELSDKPARIDPSGDIDLPITGKLHASGLTMDQLKEKLVAQFSKEVNTPRVSIEIVDFGSQPVSVTGAVNHPGVHQLRGHKTLLEVVSMAEGFRQDAGPRIHISRQIGYGTIPLPTAKMDPTGQFSVANLPVKELLSGANPAGNIQILPHDTITVPWAESVYVMGDVRKPGEVALKDNVSISVLQALASAEGCGPASSPQQAKIVRPVPGTPERKEIPVNLTRIQAGKDEDIAMQPNDILIVPPSGSKRAAARAVEAAIQTATGIAIWHPY